MYIHVHVDTQTRRRFHRTSGRRKERKKGKREGKSDASRIGRDELIILQWMAVVVAGDGVDDELLEQRKEKYR